LKITNVNANHSQYWMEFIILRRGEQLTMPENPVVQRTWRAGWDEWLS
jgi:hypothetical protein